MEIYLSSEELSNLIGEIYGTSLSAKWSDILEKIIDITQSNKAFFFLRDLTSDTPLILEFKTNFEYPQQVLLQYQSQINSDPFYQETQNIPEGEFINCNEVIDIKKYEDTDFYKNVLVPMKSHYVVGSILCRDGKHDACLVMNRGKDQLPYHEKDTNLLKLLTPHFSRAIHIFKELKLYKSYANISKSILDQNDKAIIVCDENGQIILSNKFANSHLSGTSNVLIGQNNTLELNNNIYQKRLNHFIKQCSQLSYQNIAVQETIIIEAGENQTDNILISVSPLINKNVFNDLERPCCLVTINFQQQLNWPQLQREFNLTPKELALLRALYSKKKLNELTQVFSVTYNTLRTHLQAIFKKVAVNSQSELMVKINLFK